MSNSIVNVTVFLILFQEATIELHSASRNTPTLRSIETSE